MSGTFNNLVRFPLTQDFIDHWSNTAVARFIVDGYLELRVSRKDYTVITEGGLKTKTGYCNQYGEGTRKRLGFRLRVRSQLEDLYIALIELANYTGGNCSGLQPIEVIDYVYRHDRSDRDRGYRIRTGVFEGEFQQVTGASTQGFIDCASGENTTGERYASGFSFKFMEVYHITTYF